MRRSMRAVSMRAALALVLFALLLMCSGPVSAGLPNGLCEVDETDAAECDGVCDVGEDATSIDCACATMFGDPRAPSVYLDSMPNLRGVATGDLDGDGDVDVVVASYSSGQVLWYETADGVVGAGGIHIIDASLSGAWAVAVGDMDGDDDMDVLATGASADDVVWYENDGTADPSFTEHSIDTYLDNAQAVKVADMDGDGDMDVVATGASAHDVVWYENNGAADPTFSKRTIDYNLYGARGAVAVDLDGDGDMDLVVAAYDVDDIMWYQNNGAQSFHKHTIETNLDGAEGITVGDVDGDGDLDVVATGYHADDVVWYENSGTLSPSFTKHTIDSNVDGAVGVALADFDGDGSLDIVVAAYVADDVVWFRNDGAVDPTFTMYTIEASLNDAHSVAVADVNGDTTPDILVTGDKFMLYPRLPSACDGTCDVNDGAESPDCEGVCAVGDAPGSPDCDGACTVDDEAGSADCGTYCGATDWANSAACNGVCVAGSDHAASIDCGCVAVFGDPRGPFGGILDTALDYTRGVAVGDLDGDNDLDVVATGYAADDVVWYENDGTGGVVAKHTIDANLDGAWGVTMADLDGDGDMDVVAAGFWADDIMWYENDGAESFAERTIDSYLNGARNLVVADLDDDSDLDVVAVGYDADYVVWYQNNGAADPSFTERTIDSSLNGASDLVVVDLDNDGDLDVVAVAFNADDVVWYESNGAAVPSFTKRTIDSYLNGASGVAVGDMDGDGDLDVVATGLNADIVVWYESNGAADPSFTERTIANVDGALYIEVADLDGDGDLDVVGTAQNAGTVSWYESDGAAPPSFTAHVIEDSWSNPQGVAVGDLNGSGSLDVVAVAYTNDVVMWFAGVESATRCDGTCDVHDSAESPDCDGVCDVGDAAGSPDCDGACDVGDKAGSADCGTHCGAADHADSVACNSVCELGSDDAVSIDCGCVALFEDPRGPTGGVLDSSLLGARQVVMIDLDLDGHLDLVVTAFDADDVVWYKGDGAGGTVGKYTIENYLNGAGGLAVADLDGDGDLDVVAGGFYANDVIWYENNGGATSFTERAIDYNLAGAWHVAVADMDSDGDIDVVVTGSSADDVVWYENNGALTPSFVKHTITATLNGVRGVAAVDMDGDTHVDVVVAAFDDNSVVWFKNDGAADPSFSRFTIDGSLSGAHDVAVVDMDGDSDLDVVVTSYYADDVVWYKNDGAENFEKFFIEDNLDGPLGLVATDIDGDGDMDVVVAAEVANQVVFYDNDGTATFTPYILDEGRDARYVAVGDWDGNGSEDVVATYFHEDDVQWYATPPNPGCDGTCDVSDTAGSPDCNGVCATTDVAGSPDCDGACDVGDTLGSADCGTHCGAADMADSVACNGVCDAGSDHAASIDCACMAPYGDSRAPASITLDILLDAPRHVAVGDLDGDGDHDVVATGYDADDVVWYENNGAGGLVVKHTIDSNLNGAAGVAVVDLDSDGDLDVVAAGYLADDIVWYENDGAASPSFTLRLIDGSLDGAWDVAIADVDGDFDLDIVATGHLADDVVWYESNGLPDPSFTKVTIQNNLNGARQVAVEDLDGDGDMDVVVAADVADDVVWYENNGAADPSFTTHIIDTYLDGAWGVAVTNMGGGGMDILATGSNADVVAWYEGDGTGGFTKRVIDADMDGAESVAAADVDGDGDMDVVVAAVDGDVVAWYENNGAELFPTKHIIDDNLDGASGVVLAELDGDGFLDVVAVGFYADTVVWYPSTHNCDGVCGGGDAGTRDCDGTCDAGEGGSVDCNCDGDGVCQVGEDNVGGCADDCNGACEMFELPDSIDCDQTCDVSDDHPSVDCGCNGNGVCDLEEAAGGDCDNDCDGTCDEDDVPGSVDCPLCENPPLFASESTCTAAHCFWCATTETCVEDLQCTGNCGGLDACGNPCACSAGRFCSGSICVPCAFLSSCSDCNAYPGCTWCEDASGNGLQCGSSSECLLADDFPVTHCVMAGGEDRSRLEWTPGDGDSTTVNDENGETVEVLVPNSFDGVIDGIASSNLYFVSRTQTSASLAGASGDIGDPNGATATTSFTSQGPTYATAVASKNLFLEAFDSATGEQRSGATTEPITLVFCDLAPAITQQAVVMYWDTNVGDWRDATGDCPGDVQRVFQNVPTVGCVTADVCHLTQFTVFFEETSGSGVGDPHFEAFNGGSYEFMGEPGKVYNIFSDRELQMNARFVTLDGLDGTYMGEIGVQLGRDAYVVVHRNGTVVLPVRATRNKKDPKQRYVLSDNGATMYWNQSCAVIEWDVFKVHLTRYESGDVRGEAHGITGHSLGFKIYFDEDRLLQEGRFPHGVLGQTALLHTVVVSPLGAKQGEGVVEGHFSDYEIRSGKILGADFTFNQFAPTK